MIWPLLGFCMRLVLRRFVPSSLVGVVGVVGAGGCSSISNGGGVTGDGGISWRFCFWGVRFRIWTQTWI